ncbi:MAG: FliA/WhiG family RNA polymerase sigma factor [Phycisphaerae bacterium]
MIARAENTTKDVTVELWRKYLDGRDDQARNALLVHYQPLVERTARVLRSRLPRLVEMDDLVSAGTFGLLSAVQGFDPARGIRFEAYSPPRIRGAMLDELRSMDWSTRRVRSQTRKLDRAKSELTSRLGRLPLDSELSAHLNLSEAALRRCQRDASVTSPLSLDGGVDYGQGRQFREIDALQDRRAEDPLRQVMHRELYEKITHGLARTERLVLLMYYSEEMTLTEIGKTLDLSESRICQIHSSVLARLRGSLGADGGQLPGQ